MSNKIFDILCILLIIIAFAIIVALPIVSVHMFDTAVNNIIDINQDGIDDYKSCSVNTTRYYNSEIYRESVLNMYGAELAHNKSAMLKDHFED